MLPAFFTWRIMRNGRSHGRAAGEGLAVDLRRTGLVNIVPAVKASGVKCPDALVQFDEKRGMSLAVPLSQDAAASSRRNLADSQSDATCVSGR